MPLCDCCSKPTGAFVFDKCDYGCGCKVLCFSCIGSECAICRRRYCKAHTSVYSKFNIPICDTCIDIFDKDPEDDHIHRLTWHETCASCKRTLNCIIRIQERCEICRSLRSAKHGVCICLTCIISGKYPHHYRTGCVCCKSYKCSHSGCRDHKMCKKCTHDVVSRRTELSGTINKNILLFL
jgi:hypothetical protein